MSNYTPLHIHTDYSNPTTILDSVAKPQHYIDAAREWGMTALAFTEHGNIYGWRKKKDAVEAAGMKYIHAMEAYVTASPGEGVRDNYHCVLIARNKEGVFELNRLFSRSFNKDDGHFYYTPRITMDELFTTSKNIIVTSACIGGLLGEKAEPIQERIVDFFASNRDRCFFEIAHHPDPRQVEHNLKLYDLSRKTGVLLTYGPDAHAVGEDRVEGRLCFQKGKKINFADEGGWDMQFRSYPEIVEAFEKQELAGGIPREAYLGALDNTNRIAGMVEPFEVDRSPKYPHVPGDPYNDLLAAARRKAGKHKYLNERYSPEEIDRTICEEMEVYKQCGAVDYMLLRNHLQDWQDEQGIVTGPGRGSVSGSMLAYILGITQMDSKRFGLNLFRFLNPERVSLADIDTDYAAEDRDKVKEYLLRDHMGMPGLKSAEIITYNTVELKGAIRDIARAMQIPYEEVGSITKVLENENEVAKWKKKYPELFRIAETVAGTIVSIGTHPSGVLIYDRDGESEIGLCAISSTPYPVSCLDMKELDGDMWVKWDVLGLANVGLINQTCKFAGIEPRTPDNTPLDDPKVWESIREDNTTIFQWESPQAGRFLKRLLSPETIRKVKARNKNFSMLKWFSFGNGLLRPACASFRDEAADGEFKSTGLAPLDEFLAPEMGHISMQETIMQFLVKFCGYSGAESDSARRCIAKKKGTDKLLPEVEARFVKYTPEHYGASKEECEKIIGPFIKTIEDASEYGFSWNHSDAYSCIGYICGWLRYYYPCEYIAAALNIFADKSEKIAAIMEYARTKKISVTAPKFGYSKWTCYFDKEAGVVSKGLSSVKGVSETAANSLYEIAHKIPTDVPFVEVLRQIYSAKGANRGQVETLIQIGFFSKWGNSNLLMAIHQMYDEKLDRGDRATVKVSSLTEAEREAAAPYLQFKSDKGTELVNAKILDVGGVSAALEGVLRQSGIQPPTVRELAEMQHDLMGYVDLTTGKKEDKADAIILDVKPLISQRSKTAWAYVLQAQSIGNGVIANVTVKKSLFERRPVKQYDMIRLLACGQERGYYYLYDYVIK